MNQRVAQGVAPAPQRTALTPLRDLQANRPKGLRSCLVFLPATRPRLGGFGPRARRVVGGATLRRGRTGAVRSVGRFGVRLLPEGVLQLFRVEARLLEGSAPAAVREGKERGAAHVLRSDLTPIFPSGQGARGLRGHYVAAQTVHPELGAQGGYLVKDIFRDPGLREPLPGPGHRVGGFGVDGGPPPREALGVGLVVEAPAYYLYPLVRIAATDHLDRYTEAVQQLRPEFPLLRVHSAHQHKARRMPDADALAFDVVHAHGRHVEEEVYEVVGE